MTRREEQSDGAAWASLSWRFASLVTLLVTSLVISLVITSLAALLTLSLSLLQAELLNFEELASVEALLNNTGTSSSNAPPSCPSSLPGQSPQTMLTYEDFCSLRPHVPPRALRYMSSAFFLSFPPDIEGRISATAFFKRLCSSICIAKTRITLQFYDQSNRGRLREVRSGLARGANRRFFLI